MIDRLKKIIAYHKLSASSFADMIDVPRSSISHLLSGRNKPSLDFIIKVEKAFDEVELNWLIYGKGDFPKREVLNQNHTKPVKEIKENLKDDTPSLFSENIVFDKLPNQKSNTRFSENTKSHNDLKKITRVLLFFNDGSFESYVQ